MVKKFKSYAGTKSSGGLSRRTVSYARGSGPTSQNELKPSGVENPKESSSAGSSATIEKNESSVYLDSSALIKLYVTEPDSKAVAQFVTGLQQPLPFSHLHDLEMKNGLRLKVFRGEASEKSADAAVRLIEQDHSTGVLQRPDLNWVEVFRKAVELSHQHSSRTGSRSLDLLHIASALLLQSKDFLTFDDRQAAVTAGLNRIRL